MQVPTSTSEVLTPWYNPLPNYKQQGLVFVPNHGAFPGSKRVAGPGHQGPLFMVNLFTAKTPEMDTNDWWTAAAVLLSREVGLVKTGH